MAGSIAQLKNVYPTAHSTGNKQEELEAMILQESYDIVAITETTMGGGMTHMTGLLQQMTLNSSEETGKEGEAVGQLCMLGAVLTAWSLVM